MCQLTFKELAALKIINILCICLKKQQRNQQIFHRCKFAAVFIMKLAKLAGILQQTKML